MINGPTKTEAQYRAVVMDSSSSLKEFSMNRKKYYKRYVLNEKVEEEDNKAATMGRVVETMLLEPDEFDKRFHLSVCTSSPTGLMLEFVEALYRRTAESTSEEGLITRPFEDICRDAHTDSGFKIKLDAVLTKFLGSDAEVYYKEIREVRSKGLTVVSTDDLTTAERIVNELKTNEFTANFVNLVNSNRWSVHNQLQVEGYEVFNHKFKSMMDKMIVDHDNKQIQVYDLKCTWSVENFYEEYYLYRRAYIQGYLYYHAVCFWASEMGYGDYTILNPVFIVCDSTNYMSPLLYQMGQEAFMNAEEGFTHKGKTYSGVKSIVADLKWAIENDRWNISRENYLNNGVVKL
jgi:hypothetical protein